MGTALLLGDLPPQMLHSVSGAEFLDFIWMDGRPSSFPILMVTFVSTLPSCIAFGFRNAPSKAPGAGAELPFDAKIPDPLFAKIVVIGFFATILGMSFREFFG